MSATLTHSVTHAMRPATDYAALLVSQLPTFGSVLVAALALRFSAIQGRRSHQLAERANTLAANKLRSDEWERRFGAWSELADSATAFIQKLVNTHEPDDVFFTMSEQIAFDAAAEKVFFLFPEDVTEAVEALRDALLKVRVAEAGMRSTEGPQRVTLSRQFTDALTESEEARTALKLAIRRYL